VEGNANCGEAMAVVLLLTEHGQGSYGRVASMRIDKLGVLKINQQVVTKTENTDCYGNYKGNSSAR
jgi:hypothetical protein